MNLELPYLLSCVGLGVAHALDPLCGPVYTVAGLACARAGWGRALRLAGGVALGHAVGVLALGLAAWRLTEHDQLNRVQPLVAGARTAAAALTFLAAAVCLHAWMHPGLRAAAGRAVPPPSTRTLWRDALLAAAGGAILSRAALTALLYGFATRRAAVGILAVVAVSVGVGCALMAAGMAVAMAHRACVSRPRLAFLARGMELLGGAAIAALGVSLALHAAG